MKRKKVEAAAEHILSLRPSTENLEMKMSAFEGQWVATWRIIWLQKNAGMDVKNDDLDDDSKKIRYNDFYSYSHLVRLHFVLEFQRISCRYCSWWENEKLSEKFVF